MAHRDPRVPWYAKLFIPVLVGYAFSPVDFIPDFIPILGYWDDLILLPIGITLKDDPYPVVEESRQKTEQHLKQKPTNWVAGFIIMMVWVAFLSWFILKIR